MNKELSLKTAEINRLMNEARSAYEERDQLNQFVSRENELAKQEASEFQEELRKLIYLEEKNQINMKAYKASIESSQPQSEAQQVKENVIRVINLEREKSAETLAKFQLDAAKIRCATGVSAKGSLPSNVKKIYECFEDKNFGEYKVVIDLAAEAEDLETQIVDLRRKLSQQKSSDFCAKNRRSNSLMGLKNENSYKSKSIIKLQDEYAKVNGELYDLTSTLKILWSRFGFDLRDFTPHNPEMAIKAIEEKLDLSLLHYSALISTKFDLKHIKFDSRPIELNKKFAYNATFPEMFEENDNSRTVLLSAEEMRQNAMKRIANFESTLHLSKAG